MKKGCVIVETRIIPDLYEIIAFGHLQYVPYDWGLTIYLSEQNKHLIDPKMFMRKVDINILPDNFSVSDYNKLLTSKSFWNGLYDRTLVFQTDSQILRTGIEEFLEWDYIGACWSWQQNGANGGFSLRSKKAMIDVIEKEAYNESTHGNEDVYFSNLLRVVGGKLAPREECMKFSTEGVVSYGTIGFHAIDKYLTKEECEYIRNQYRK